MSVISVETQMLSELQSATGLQDSDLLYVELTDGGSKKMTFGDLVTAIKASISYPEEAILSVADIVSVQTDDGTKIPAASVVYAMYTKETVMQREQACINGSRAIGERIDLDTLMGYIRAGENDKFAIGDYFTDGGVDWAIVAKNHYPAWAFGDGVARPNHVVCMPVTFLATSYQYNTSNTNSGGYAGSLMPANMEAEYNKLSAKLKGYIRATRIYENNKSAWAAAMRNMRIPTIVELTGNQGWADQYSGGVCSQFPLCQSGLFRIASTWYWALDPVASNATNFRYVSYTGISYDGSASGSGRVRPEIVLA